MDLRKNDPRYLGHVKRWFDTLLPRMAPYLYHRGGPILMTQVGTHVWVKQASTSASCLSCTLFLGPITGAVLRRQGCSTSQKRHGNDTEIVLNVAD